MPLTVRDITDRDVPARVIARSKHDRVPVVQDGRLVGVVTRVDVLDALTADDDAA